jgi:uncharacterized membrane protein YccC
MRLRPKLLKYLFGHHILNGVVVAVGVFLVGLFSTWAFGFLPGMAAASGALCVSIGDTSTPFAAKTRILPIAWICASIATFATALAAGSPLGEGVAVVAIGFAGGLLIALGRWAIPLSVLTLLAMVFTLGAPHDDLAGRLHYALMSSLGGALYIPIALALTRATDISGRRLTLAEVLREFASYLRRVAGFYRKDADEGAVCLKVVEHQASFADHLQTARSLIVSGGRHAEATRLIAALAAVLEAFDGIVSTLADHAPLRLADSPGGLAAQMERFLIQLAADLDALALELVLGDDKLIFADQQPALDDFARQIAALESESGVDTEVLRAARLTRARVGLAVSHLARLPDLLNRQDLAEQALAGIDLSAFAPPLRVSVEAIAEQWRWSSPIFRHALRLSLALGFGYALIEFVPGLGHGNWILLTIAVIMRAGYSATTQRRDQRLFGSVLGCGLAGALLWINSPGLLLGVQLLAVAVAHAYVKVDYRVTSVAATVMALLGLHLIDPVAAAPVGARLVDTVVGAGVAFLFNFLLPQWESQSAPQVAQGFLRALHRYADRALRWDAPEQDYRLARKTLMEAFSALGESAGRMRADPAAQRDLWPEYSKLIATAYVAAAQIVTVRLFIRNRRNDLDPIASKNLLDDTRRAALAELDMAGLRADRRLPSESLDDTVFSALRQRCDEVLREARALRRLAEEDFALAERLAA